MRLGEGGLAQSTQQGEVVGPGQRGEFLGVEAGGAEEVERGGGAVLEGGEGVPEALGGVGAPSGEAGFDGGRGRAGAHAECGAEGVVAVGSEDEGAGALPGRGERGGGGDGGTAGAAGARDQEGAHGGERYRCVGGAGVPVGRRVRSPAVRGAAAARPRHPRGRLPGRSGAEEARLPAATAGSAARGCVGGGRPRPRYFDSTRFFRPARARSMMTFSALRLIMPSIGILTSTVSR